MTRILTDKEIMKIESGGSEFQFARNIAHAQRDLSDRENAEAIQELENKNIRLQAKLTAAELKGFEAIQQARRDTAKDIFKEIEEGELIDAIDHCSMGGIFDALKAKYLPESKREPLTQSDINEGIPDITPFIQDPPQKRRSR